MARWALAGVLLLGCQPALPAGFFGCRVNADCPDLWFCHDDERCYPDAPGLAAPDLDGGPDGHVDMTTPEGDGGVEAAVAECTTPLDCLVPAGLNVLPTCVMSQCGARCMPHHDDCSEAPGCESLVETRTQCGSCKVSCPQGEHCSHGECRTLGVADVHTIGPLAGGSEQFAVARAAVFDSRGSLFVAGSFQGDLELLDAEVPTGLLARYDAVGGFSNLMGLKSDRADRGGSLDAITVDAGGSVYVAGTCQLGVALDFVGDAPRVTPLGEDDVCVASYEYSDHSMRLRWQQWFGGANGVLGTERPTEVAVSGSTLFVLGSFTDEFGGSTSLNVGNQVLYSEGAEDIFVVRIDVRDGRFLGADSFGSEGRERVSDSAIDPNSGELVLAGSFEGSFRLGSEVLATERDDGSSDLFVARMSADGRMVRAMSLGGAGHDDALGVAVAPDSSIWLFGTLDTDQAPVAMGSGRELIGPGKGDLFVAHYSRDFEHLESRIFGSTSFDGSEFPHEADATIDEVGNFYISGSISGSVDLGETTLAVEGSQDTLFASFDPAGGLRYAFTMGSPSDTGSGGRETGQAIAVRSARGPAVLLPEQYIPSSVTLAVGEQKKVADYVVVRFDQ